MNMHKWYIEDFTENNYRKILKLVKNKMEFISYTQFFEEAIPVKQKAIWRHDIDFSVHRALKIAEIEKEENVLSIFFVQLNSRFYNVFEPEILEKLMLISRMGHEIGVHFDCSILKDDFGAKELEKELHFQKEILEHLLNVKIRTFSYHNPSHSLLEDYAEKQYAGLYNAYANEVRNKLAYCSDSNGYWRFKRLENFIHENEAFCVLTHPVWWVPEAMSPRNRIQRAIDGRQKAMGKSYDDDMVLSGRINVM